MHNIQVSHNGTPIHLVKHHQAFKNEGPEEHQIHGVNLGMEYEALTDTGRQGARDLGFYLGGIAVARDRLSQVMEGYQYFPQESPEGQKMSVFVPPHHQCKQSGELVLQGARHRALVEGISHRFRGTLDCIGWLSAVDLGPYSGMSVRQIAAIDSAAATSLVRYEMGDTDTLPRIRARTAGREVEQPEQLIYRGQMALAEALNKHTASLGKYAGSIVMIVSSSMFNILYGWLDYNGERFPSQRQKPRGAVVSWMLSDTRRPVRLWPDYHIPFHRQRWHDQLVGIGELNG